VTGDQSRLAERNRIYHQLRRRAGRANALACQLSRRASLYIWAGILRLYCYQPRASGQPRSPDPGTEWAAVKDKALAITSPVGTAPRPSRQGTGAAGERRPGCI
jgi:hypothetical protein